MRLWFAAALLGATGCRGILGIDDPVTARDAAADSTPDPADGPADASLCFGSFQPICLDRLPTTPLTIDASTTLDTSGLLTCTKVEVLTTGELCVFAVTSFSINASATLSVTGSRALAIVSTGPIVIAGTLDVSSRRGGAAGPGANFSGCGVATIADNSGGPGGSFRTKGGDGGAGTGNMAIVGSSAVVPAGIRGGCRGGTGGVSSANSGGAGGGAIALVGPSIEVGGVINASGAGGQGAQGGDRGGGGGGSGGLIVLDAPDVRISASGVVMSHGGGGGEGSGTFAGMPGVEANPASPLTTPVGGANGSSSGGNGGNGGAGSSLPGNGLPGAAPGGGGGGGGSTGFIKSLDMTPVLAGTVTPPFG